MEGMRSAPYLSPRSRCRVSFSSTNLVIVSCSPASSLEKLIAGQYASDGPTQYSLRPNDPLHYSRSQVDLVNW